MKTKPNDPINAISEEETDRVDCGVKIYTGLTKREHMAIEFTKALLANSDIINHGIGQICIARRAIVMADELIKQLNEKTT